MQTTLIAFRDTEQVKELLQMAAGPHGDLSKVARAIIREGLERRGFWPPEMTNEVLKRIYESDIKCPRCGSVNDCTDGTWRWAGDHWQHRCADVHPQAGHWRMDP